MVRRLQRWFTAAFAVRVPYFARWLPASAPLVVTRYHHDPYGLSRNLLVCLPGIGDLAEDYHTRGFIQPLRKMGVEIDVMTVDAHYGYYTGHTLVQRLREDVMVPALEAGYENISLLGISLGGLGSLLYAQAHPEDVSRLIVLAPFLGRTAVKEIDRAGGLASWHSQQSGALAFERSLWQWLTGYLDDRARMPPLHLAFGERDRFAPAHRVLAAVLPPQHVHTGPGGHSWKTWRRLWLQMLADGFALSLIGSTD